MNERKARALAKPRSYSTASASFTNFILGARTREGAFVGVLVGMDCHYLNNPCPAYFFDLQVKRKMPLRINLDLEPEYERFVKKWADQLGIRPSELLRRVVHETCNGYRYEENIPNYYPLERRPDWKRLDRRRDRRKKREAARRN
jgi:hypothetical protein